MERLLIPITSTSSIQHTGNKEGSKKITCYVVSVQSVGDDIVRNEECHQQPAISNSYNYYEHHKGIE